jgi:hypothetical protein
VWLVSWAILHVALRGKRFETGRALTIGLVLIGIGVVGTFPHLLPTLRCRVNGRLPGKTCRAALSRFGTRGPRI